MDMGLLLILWSGNFIDYKNALSEEWEYLIDKLRHEECGLAAHSGSNVKFYLFPITEFQDAIVSAKTVVLCR